MSLDPSPLSPTPTPLLNPIAPVPSRGSALIGALISVGLAVIVAVVSLRFGTALIFAPAGLKAQANGVVATSPYQIQGFEYYWRDGVTLNSSETGGGYTSIPVADNIMQDEANTYHMNLVVITITLDLNDSGAQNGDSPYVLGTGDKGDTDTYPDTVYENLAKEAVKEGLTPVFRLDLRVQHGPNNDVRSINVGQGWQLTSNSKSAQMFQTLQNEQEWFNTYTAEAVKYADIAEQLNMPFFIFASNLSNLSYDTVATSQPADPAAVPGPGDTTACTGRRECEWRHVIDAIRTPSTHMYSQYNSTASTASSAQLPGGGYTHRLIYAAASEDDNGVYEWQKIKWFGAIDLIGIDAYFPLGKTRANGYHDIATDWTSSAEGQNLVQDFSTVSQQAGRPIVFTRVGYDSTGSANNKPPGKGVSSSTADPDEQDYDMGGLLLAFQSQAWWRGVIWSADYAALPRSAVSADQTQDFDDQPWATNTQWAGDCAPGGSCDHPAETGRCDTPE